MQEPPLSLMNKGIKILFHVISSVILALIILPVFTALMLYLPPVQTFAVKTAAKIISNNLGTTVSLDKINIKFFNTVSIDGFYVEDFNRDTLLYAPKVGVGILNIFGGRIALGEVRLENPRMYMVQDSDSTSNIKKILDRLKNENPSEDKKPLNLRAAGITIENMYYSYRKLDPGDKGATVNFDDLEVQRFDLRARAFSMIGDSITMRLDKIAVKEKSGLQIDRLGASGLSVSGSGIFMDDMVLDTPDSEVRMDYLRLRSGTGTWESFADFLNGVKLEAKIKNSRLAFRTIGYFADGLSGWKTVLTNMSGQFAGTVADFSGTFHNVNAGTVGLAADFKVKGIPDIPHTRFDLEIKELNADAAGIDNILADITGKPFEEELLNTLTNFGDVGLTGYFNGTLTNFDAKADIVTEQGEAALDIYMEPAGEGRRAVAGDVSLDGMNIGAIIANPQLGRLSMSAQLKGSFGGGDLQANTNAVIASAEFKGYRYRDIKMNGDFSNRLFNGKISSVDPNVSFDFNGLVDFNDSIPRYDFGLRVNNLDLARTNLNQKDSVSLLRANVYAVASGSNIDNLNGSILISDLQYINSSDSVYASKMNIFGRNDDNSKYLTFRSSVADITYRSRRSYAGMLADLRELVRNYMPTLSPAPEALDRTAEQYVVDANNYSMLDIHIKEANKAVGVFVPGLIVAKDTRMSFMFNPDIEQLSFTASSEYIEYGSNYFVSNLNMNTRNQGDSLSLFMRADDVYAGGLYMPNFSVIGGMRDNHINTSLRFMDTTRRMTALIGAASTLGKVPETGAPNVRIRLTPSSFSLGDRVWNMYTRGIEIDSSRIVVNNFNILGEGQSLRVYGVASRQKTDTLHVELNNFDLEPLSQLTSRMGYRLQGVSNGHADLISAKQNGILHALLNFDDVKVNETGLPPGRFESTWDFEQERAMFLLSNTNTMDTVMRGFYQPSTGRYIADVNLERVDLALMDPFFEGIVRDSKGEADIKTRITGRKNNLKLNGGIKIRDFTTTIDFLNVPYRLIDTDIAIKDNTLQLNGAPLYDPVGNKGELDIFVNLNSLSNVVYNISIRPHNLMVLNTTSKDNDLFFGKVFATGAAVISGDKSGVKMDITASTNDNSAFFLPLNNSATMGVSDIITFRNPEKQVVDSTDYLSRKMLILNRKKKKDETAEASNMHINIELNVLPNAEFQLLIDPKVNDILRGRGTGNLTMEINPAADVFKMNGVYEITEGSYQFSLQGIINKKFTIEPGSRITWFDDPVDAELDVTAVYTVKTSLAPLIGSYRENSSEYNRAVPVECRIMLRDRLTQPSITFDVQVPNVDPETQSLIASELSTQENISTQFISLLALNSFYSMGAGNIGAMGSSATAFDFLSNQLSNLLSTDKYHIGLRYSSKTEYTSDEIAVDFSTNLFGNRLILDVEGNYNAHNNPGMSMNNTNNVTGDFYLTWLIDKAGSLRAKGFSRTIDRFDENQGLQESGLGLYYKEDFNNVNDIVRNFKERFSRSDEKKEKRRQKKEDKKNKKAGNVAIVENEEGTGAGTEEIPDGTDE